MVGAYATKGIGWDWRSGLPSATTGAAFQPDPPRASTSRRTPSASPTSLSPAWRPDVDGLVLYDIDDESDRNPAERFFPYLPTMDPAVFLAENLVSWRRPSSSIDASASTTRSRWSAGCRSRTLPMC